MTPVDHLFCINLLTLVLSIFYYKFNALTQFSFTFNQFPCQNCLNLFANKFDLRWRRATLIISNIFMLY